MANSSLPTKAVKALQKAELIRELSRQYATGTASPPQPKRDNPTVSYLANQLRRAERHRFNPKLAILKDLGLTYPEYVRTPRWKAFRIEYIKTRGSKCEVYNCHNAGKILHHRTYDRLGHESIEDVALVCVSCHKKIHSLIP